MKMRIKNVGFKVSTLVILFLLGSSLALAHGEGGTIEIEQDGYLIDIGFSEEEIFPGVPTQLSFLLFELQESAAPSEVFFTDIWLRIEHDGEMMFASLLGRPEFGDTGMSFNFPEGGDYDLFVRYKNDDSTIIERTVRLSVSQGEVAAESEENDTSQPLVVVVAAVSFLFGLLLFAFLSGIKKIITKSKKTTISQQAKSVPAVPLEPQVLNKESKFGLKTEKITPSSKFVLFVKYAIVAFIISAITFFVTSVLLGTMTIPQWNDSLDASLSNGKTVNIVLTESGYEPSDIVIEKGTTVTFTTTANRQHWPASSLHPTHNEYPEFDPLEPVAADQSWSFTFDEEGVWSYHDHLRSYFTGKIEVTSNR
jgi:plastocyanin